MTDTDQKLLPHMPHQPYQLILDEAGYYFGRNDDALKEALRVLEGVPNATYLVREGRVFVFEKLLTLAKEQLAHTPNAPLADLARSLIPRSYVSADEAVCTWAVVPEPYELRASAPGSGGSIRHRPFNALLPGSFPSQAEANLALSRLLIGEALDGPGTFTYRGQPMTLCEPLEASLLPLRPTFPVRSVDQSPTNYAVLYGADFVPGFAPLSQPLFDEIKALETSWRDEMAGASRYARSHASAIWVRAAEFHFDLLPASDCRPGVEDTQVTPLRALYPELSMLSDSELHAWFDAYESDQPYSNDELSQREDDFLFYLLGKSANPEHNGETAIDLGTLVATFLLGGAPIEEAWRSAQAASHYDTAIANLAHRVATAMRFLQEDQNSCELRGRPISTLMDLVRFGRKHASLTVTVTQSLTDVHSRSSLTDS